jgi:hypothetical protein
MYNALVERCFKDCVVDFRSKNLAKDEEKVCSHALTCVESSSRCVSAAAAVTPHASSPPASP